MTETLIIAIYLVLIMFIIVLIILGINLIGTIKKVNGLIDDVQGKVDSFNKVFEVVDFATDRMSLITEAIIGFITAGTKKMFNSKKKSKKIIEEDDDNE